MSTLYSLTRDVIIDKGYLTMCRKFMNPSSVEKTEVPGKRALRKTRFSDVVIKDQVNIPLQLIVREDC